MVTGPSLNPDLVEILLQFRRWPFAITADIAKAFLQISVHGADKNVHRFLLMAKDGIVYDTCGSVECHSETQLVHSC